MSENKNKWFAVETRTIVSAPNQTEAKRLAARKPATQVRVNRVAAAEARRQLTNA